jgi:fibro-slime domain-containing protein
LLAATSLVACASEDSRGSGDRVSVGGDGEGTMADAALDGGGGPPAPTLRDGGDGDGDGDDDAGEEMEGCGDGVIQPGERCDDGNNEGGDGCAPDCQQVETEFVCPTPGEACVSTVECGDGIISGTETCDDGNGEGGDGCDSACTLELGWKCPVAGAACEAAACGDGVIAGSEQCEDGDVTPEDGDGCSAGCKLEPGYACDEPELECRTTVCGDGMKEGSEPCDDGNQVVGDGCNPFCEVEPDCSAGACVSRCGDGLLLPTDDEACDDGNTRDGDGCSSTCEIEPGHTCELVTTDPPETLEVAATYRDFIALPTAGNASHPDFQAFGGSDPTTGLVQDQLGSDGKPVYADICDGDGPVTDPPCPDGQQLTTQANFDQWYRDVPGVNVTLVERMSLMRQADGSYLFPDPAFFPFDGSGWVASGEENASDTHNFGFTSEVRYWFEFRGDEVLTFSGDDDVWVFIGGQLALDLGGLHPERNGTVTLDVDTAAALGLKVGNIYEIALFHAERHTDASNFNLTLAGFTGGRSVCETECGDGIVAGDERCDDGENDGSYGGCTAECLRAPFCGDGERQKDEGEECDDGVNLTPYDTDGEGCSPGCKRPGFCGDGVTQGMFGERCDDGEDNADGYGKCRTDCTFGPRCGDGQVQEDEGEECDDFNLVRGDGCDDACKLEAPE